MLDGRNLTDGRTPIEVTHTNGWRSVELKGERGSWEDRELGSKQSPVTVWARDMIEGDPISDIVICRENRCTDVSAWYVLAGLDKELGFPSEVEGLLPQDAAGISRISHADTHVIRYHLEHIKDPVKGTVFAQGASEDYTLADRVYVEGTRNGGTGVEDCVGWFDRPAELDYDSDRFLYICFATSVGVFSGFDNRTGLKDFKTVTAEYSRSHAPKVTADLYGNLPIRIRGTLLALNYVTEEWSERHIIR